MCRTGWESAAVNVLVDVTNVLLSWAMHILCTVLKFVIALLLLRASFELILSGLKGLFRRRSKKTRRRNKRHK